MALTACQVASVAILTDASLLNGTVGQPYSVTLDATGGTPPYTWATAAGTLPLGLTLDPETGIISGTPTAAATWKFTVLLADANNETAVKDFVLTTTSNSSPPSGLTIVNGSSLPNGTIGEPYSVVLEATGGTLPYIWSVVVGSLPPGLALNANTGEISGIPTTAGTYGFTIQVADNSGLLASKPFALAPPPSSGSAGSPYSVPVTISDPVGDDSGGTNSCSAYTVVSGTLPEGLVLDPSAGIISGTPTTPGTYNFIVQCATATNQTAIKGFTITILPPNQTPTANAGGPYSVAEGSSVLLFGSGTDPDGDSLTYAWDLNGDGIFEAVTQNPVFSAAGLDGSGSATVTLRVADGNGHSATDLAAINITNVPPTISLSADPSVNEGAPYTLNLGAITDPGVDTVIQWSVHWGDGTTDTYSSGGDVTHTYADGGNSYTILVDLTDEDGTHSSAGSLAVVVNNVAPTVTASGDSINEHTNATINGTISDPGSQDFFTVVIDWGDGTSNTYTYAAGTTTFAETHSYLDDNPTGTMRDDYIVTITVTDKDGGNTSVPTIVTVTNVAPVITAVTAPSVPVNINNQPVTVEVQFSDVGTQDTHKVTWDWADGSAADVQEDVASPASADHIYANPGVYTVQVTVEDDDTGSARQIHEFIVIYNPEAGFVSGGGWINSPAGAYLADPNLTGKANFGFVSKYKKGANTPTGETQFQFKAAGLNFHSSSYEWLVVAGSRAQYKGNGSVNGADGYKFLLTGIDADVNRNDAHTEDKFRIKIWQDVNGGEEVIYDNQAACADTSTNADPCTTLGGGSIVVHDGKNSKSVSVENTSSETLPNASMLYLPLINND